MKSSVFKMEVRFVDIDVMGHVNNAVYLNYFEQARMHFFKEKIGQDWDWVNHGILLARNEIDYASPALLNDQLNVRIWCSTIGNKSLEFSYEVFALVNHQEIMRAKGKSILVCFDYQQKKTIPVPEIWRNSLM